MLRSRASLAYNYTYKVDFVINEMDFPEGDIVDYAECIEVTKA